MIEKFAENVVESKEQFLRESVGKENAQIQGKDFRLGVFNGCDFIDYLHRHHGRNCR